MREATLAMVLPATRVQSEGSTARADATDTYSLIARAPLEGDMDAFDLLDAVSTSGSS